MTREDLREALKWALVGAVIVALWCGVLAVRKARASESAYGIRPVWVIFVYEIRNEKLVGITEFVFSTRQQCQKSAAKAKQDLELHTTPGCYLRWEKGEAEAEMGGGV